MLRLKDIKNNINNDSYKKLATVIRQVAEASKYNKSKASLIIYDIRNYLSHKEHETSQVEMLDEIKDDISLYCSKKSELANIINDIIVEINKDRIDLKDISLTYIGLLILYSDEFVDIFYNIWCGAVRSLIKDESYFDDYKKIESDIIKQIYNEKSKIDCEDFSYKTFVHEKLVENIKDYPTVGVLDGNWDARFMENAFRFFTKELDSKPKMFDGIKEHNYSDGNNNEQSRGIKHNLGKKLKAITFRKVSNDDTTDEKVYVLSKIALQRMLYNYVMGNDFNLAYKEPSNKKDKGCFSNYLESISENKKDSLAKNSKLITYLEKNWHELNSRYNIYSNWQYKSIWLDDMIENRHNIAVSIYTYLNRMNNANGGKKKISQSDKIARNKELLDKYLAKKDEKPKFIALFSGLNLNNDSLGEFLTENFIDLTDNYNRLVDTISGSRNDTVYTFYKNLCDYEMTNGLKGMPLLKSFVNAKKKNKDCKMLDFFADKLKKEPKKNDKERVKEERILPPFEDAFYKEQKLAIFTLPKLEKTKKIGKTEYGSAYCKLQDNILNNSLDLTNFANGNKVVIDEVKKIIKNKDDKLFFIAIDNILLYLAYDKLSKKTNKSFKSASKIVNLKITDSNNKDSKINEYIELGDVDGKPIYIKRVNNSLVSYINNKKSGVANFLKYLLESKRDCFENVKIANITRKYYDETSDSKVYKECYLIDKNFFQSYVVDLGILYEEIFEFERAFCAYYGLMIDGLADNHIKFCCYEAYASDTFFKDNVDEWHALTQYRNDICHVSFIDMTNKDKAKNFIKKWCDNHKGEAKTMVNEVKYCNKCIDDNKLKNK